MPEANSTTPTPQPAGELFEAAPGVAIERGALRFSFSSSAGPGGQNVNKRATKAELRVALGAIPLPGDALSRLRALAGRRVTDAGDLVITSDEHRSQGRNRAACLERLGDLVKQAMVKPLPRRRTRPTKGSVERRLTAKRAQSQRKQRRTRPDD